MLKIFALKRELATILWVRLTGHIRLTKEFEDLELKVQTSETK